MKSYNQFHYKSLPIPETHPRHLAVLGRLFGLGTADVERCRVLELGCATGGNIIPMAFHYPDAECVGIDLSASQIEVGQQLINNLGLTNIELRQGNILDLNNELGVFDYIIAHGVYSWVPEPVREQLLKLSRLLLRPGGLVYISFNTLPGWHMRGTLRDFLLYACRTEKSDREKLKKAVEELGRLDRALDGLEALSAKYLREEIRIAQSADPSYLLYEHLADENTPFLFTDFLNDTRCHGLRYLCDTELATLFPATYGEAVERELESIGDDMALEQWLDFVSNRNMRRSLLCRDDEPATEALSLDAFSEFAFSTNLIPPEKIIISAEESLSLKQPDGTPVQISHPLTKMMVLEMIAAQPAYLSLGTLFPKAHQKLVSHGFGGYAEDYESCLMELFSLFSHRTIEASPQQIQCHNKRGDKPRATALARAQSTSGAGFVTTATHGDLEIDEAALRLLTYLDGEHTLDQVVALFDQGKDNETLQSFAGSDGEENTFQLVQGLVDLFQRLGIVTYP